jgi:2-keto-4-pentenoate hydratase/2-oxohepta-3-ene-1,7-dioic acid hydratase in catechol pathway
MKLLRYTANGRESYGVLDGDTVKQIDGTPFEKITTTGEQLPLDSVRLLAPSRPRSIVAVGLNYRQHSVEFGMELQKEPLLFPKALSSALDPFGRIIKPEVCERPDYEAELAVVIKKACARIRPEDAREYILGYTCLNDVTARDIQKKESQWLRAKGFYTFCPFGPWIETEIDPGDLRLQAVLNGKTVQDDRTSSMLFSVDYLVSYISGFMQLEAGDVIATGTPGGIGPMKSGDEIKIIIEGIGELVNYVE